MHGILAAIVAAIWEIPILGYLGVNGFAMPEVADDFGLPIGAKIFPAYSVGLVAGTVLIVMIAVTIVSFLPSRRIAGMNPTDALRGKTS